MNDAEIKAALAVLITADGNGKRAKCEALEKLILDVVQYGPVSVLHTLQSNH